MEAGGLHEKCTYLRLRYSFPPTHVQAQALIDESDKRMDRAEEF